MAWVHPNLSASFCVCSVLPSARCVLRVMLALRPTRCAHDESKLQQPGSLRVLRFRIEGYTATAALAAPHLRCAQHSRGRRLRQQDPRYAKVTVGFPCQGVRLSCEPFPVWFLPVHASRLHCLCAVARSCVRRVVPQPMKPQLRRSHSVGALVLGVQTPQLRLYSQNSSQKCTCPCPTLATPLLTVGPRSSRFCKHFPTPML